MHPQKFIEPNRIWNSSIKSELSNWEYTAIQMIKTAEEPMVTTQVKAVQLGNHVST
jgi:hypothetical protein